MLSRLRLNWGIYETDIVYLGGEVSYTNRIHATGRRSQLVEATVTIDGYACSVLMERFRHGNGVITAFMQNGQTVSKGEWGSCCRAHLFLDAYSKKREADDRFLEFYFFRKVKQAITFLGQILSLVGLILSVSAFIQHPGSRMVAIIAIFLCAFLFMLLGSLYRKYRNRKPQNYRPWLFKED